MSQFFCCCLSLARSAEKREIGLRIEKERKEGQALLRSMAQGSTNKVDWQAIIKKAEELHQREQEWLRQQDSRERRRFVQGQRRALQKRRKYDAIGNFSINMLTYSMEPASQHISKANKSVTSSMGSTKEDPDEDVSSVGSHGAPFPKPVDEKVDAGDPVSSTHEINNVEERRAPDRYLMCPSSSSSFMDVFEDRLHGPDSDSI